MAVLAVLAVLARLCITVHFLAHPLCCLLPSVHPVPFLLALTLGLDRLDGAALGMLGGTHGDGRAIDYQGGGYGGEEQGKTW